MVVFLQDGGPKSKSCWGPWAELGLEEGDCGITEHHGCCSKQQGPPKKKGPPVTGPEKEVSPRLALTKTTSTHGHRGPTGRRVQCTVLRRDCILWEGRCCRWWLVVEGFWHTEEENCDRCCEGIESRSLREGEEKTREDEQGAEEMQRE